MKTRGVYEKEPGSDSWWIRYADASGRIRRELAGRKGAAIRLYRKRKTEVLEGKKLPTNMRTQATTFAAIAKKALVHSRNHKRSFRDDECRLGKILSQFGHRIADQITAVEIDNWVESHQEWTRATKNRYLAVFKMVYRIAETDESLRNNPARSLRLRQENNERVRYLNQYAPLPTKLTYLKDCNDEESRILTVVKKRQPFHLPEFLVALHTGMRRSEQYATEWGNVNFERRILTVPRSKHGKARHVPLNSAALDAFRTLLSNMATSNFVFLAQNADDCLRGNRHWFHNVLKEAGIRDFTWHDLRHTFASRLVMAGIGLRSVQELMGHKSINVTARYTHLEPSQQLAAVEKLTTFSVKKEGVSNLRNPLRVSPTDIHSPNSNPEYQNLL